MIPKQPSEGQDRPAVYSDHANYIPIYEKEAREIVDQFGFSDGIPYYGRQDLYKAIALALSRVREEGRRSGIEESAKVAETVQVSTWDTNDKEEGCLPDCNCVCNRDIAQAIRNLINGGEERVESLDDQLSAVLVERDNLVRAVKKFIDDYEHQGGLISELKYAIRNLLTEKESK